MREKQKNSSKGKAKFCHFLQIYYASFKSFFDSLWKKTQDSKTKANSHGNEAGGLLWMLGNVGAADHQQVLGTATYDGPTTDKSMGRGFDSWLDVQRGRLPSGTTVIIVHTHPRNTAKPSQTDINAAVISSADEAILTSKSIVIYDKNSPNGKCTFTR